MMMTHSSATKKGLLLILRLSFVLLLVASAYFLLKEIPIKRSSWIYLDKVQHITLFFCLTALGLYLFKPYRLLLVFALLAYGGVTEYLQSAMTKTRTGSVEDWLADLVGICLACWLTWVVVRIAKRRQKQHESMV